MCPSSFSLIVLSAAGSSQRTLTPHAASSTYRRLFCDLTCAVKRHYEKACRMATHVLYIDNMIALSRRVASCLCRALASAVDIIFTGWAQTISDDHLSVDWRSATTARVLSFRPVFPIINFSCGSCCCAQVSCAASIIVLGEFIDDLPALPRVGSATFYDHCIINLLSQ